MKVDLVLGTRPEIIKLAPVYHKLKSFNNVTVSITLTGQHPDLINDFLTWFGITPNRNLKVSEKSIDLFDVCSKTFQEYAKFLVDQKIDGVIIQGDTSSGLFAGLAAFYCKVPIFHVEAGLRSHVSSSPFPEEMNRRLISRMANLHFCPTNLNKQNLLDEGIDIKSIFVTGNTVVDSLKWSINRMDKTNFKSEIQTNSTFGLVTLHRRESWDTHIDQIILGLKDSALNNPEFQLLFVMHANPSLQSVISNNLSNLTNVKLLQPVNYQNMIHLIKNSKFVLTDSGGIQEEAVSLGKIVAVARDESDRPEGILAGRAILVGRNRTRINEVVNSLILGKDILEEMNSVYGDGDSSQLISNEILRYLGN
jgi:UDP-N-acetylglucosamine 2-epimerase (non-hydrolysing)